MADTRHYLIQLFICDQFTAWVDHHQRIIDVRSDASSSLRSTRERAPLSSVARESRRCSSLICVGRTFTRVIGGLRLVSDFRLAAKRLP